MNVFTSLARDFATVSRGKAERRWGRIGLATAHSNAKELSNRWEALLARSGRPAPIPDSGRRTTCYLFAT